VDGNSKTRARGGNGLGKERFIEEEESRGDGVGYSGQTIGGRVSWGRKGGAHHF